MNRKTTTLALMFATLPASVLAQPATGLPPFGSFSGGPFDTVNNSNLNVHFEIPIIGKAGVGLPFAYTLTYDSSVWYPVTSGFVQQWTPVNNWGWNAVTAVAETGYVWYYASPQTCSGYNFNVYSGWQYHDPYGASHYFPGYVLSRSDMPAPCPNSPTTLSNVVADDGSGYVIGTITGPNGPSYSGLGAPNGVQINAPPAGQQSGPGSLTDRNGNTISVSSGSSAVFTDTLDQTALTVSGSSPTLLSYPSPSTGNPCGLGAGISCYKINYKQYTVQTKFGCAAHDWGPTSQNLVDTITLPDLTSYSFQYEATPNNSSGYVTGRLKSVTLPTGGTISYAYSGGGAGVNGINCFDGTAATLQRTTPDTVNNGAPAWQYTHSLSGCSPTSPWCTTITDPTGNVTAMSFQPVTPTGTTITNGYETIRTVNQGTGTLLETVNTCYNGVAPPNCTGSAPAYPFTSVNTYTTLSPWVDEVATTLNTYGLPTEVDEYGWGNGGRGAMIRKTTTTYASLGNIVDMPYQVTVWDMWNNVITGQATYYYDQYTQYPLQTTSGNPQHLPPPGSSRGNATTVTTPTTGTSTLTQNFAYYDTGNVYKAYDVNGAVTQYAYGACGNAFATQVTPPLSLSRSYVWNCAGAMTTSFTDENNQVWSTAYNDPNYWRPTSTTDPFPATTSYTYYTSPAFAVESTLNYNNDTHGNPQSTVDLLASLDVLGRTHVTQRKQGPKLTTYDSVETDYNAVGRVSRATVPYSAAAFGTSSSAPATTTQYDALNRATQVTDSDGGYTSYGWSQNNVLVTAGPAPNPPNDGLKKRQYQYDALGRLVLVCEVTSAAGSGACGNNVPANGFYTTIVRNPFGEVGTLTENAQTSTYPKQQRTYTYDGLGRMTSEFNPETNPNAYYYTYDTDATCGASKGDLVKRTDPVGNVTCYAFDALHRLTAVTYPSGSYAGITPQKHYVYDSAVVDNATMAYTKGRLAEAFTGTSSAKITDLGFSYTNRGQIAATYESTPNSGGFYTVVNGYWPEGSLYSRWISGTPAWYYWPDGEGRVGSVTASAYQNPVTSTSYNTFSEVKAITYGSGDSDTFGYDTNTGRMTGYTYTVGGKTVTGALTWNANGTLKTLGITDQWTPANTQTCNYGYDDLARLTSANCGSAWNQTFSYDPFGNISKSGSQSFGPTYNSATNQYTAIGPVTPTYDSNGNLTYDGFHHYGWDAEGKMQKLDTVNTWAFDALGRWAEASFNGTPVQAIYDPLGVELVLATSGRNLADARVPLVGGAMAQYTNTALSKYWHPDWLGTSRMESTPSQTVSADAAYAPFGEKYLPSNSIDDVWTGSAFQDKATDLWDFAAREYHPTQGRWVSPDPAGIGAVDPSNPQSWNRYGYGLNNPCGNIDPLGLDNCALKIAINNRAGANLAAVEAQINLILGASSSNGVDSVSASFVPAGQADYTVNIVNGSPTITAMELFRGPMYGYAPPFGSSVFVNSSTITQNFGYF